MQFAKSIDCYNNGEWSLINIYTLVCILAYPKSKIFLYEHTKIQTFRCTILVFFAGGFDNTLIILCEFKSM